MSGTLRGCASHGFNLSTRVPWLWAQRNDDPARRLFQLERFNLLEVVEARAGPHADPVWCVALVVLVVQVDGKPDEVDLRRCVVCSCSAA